jgi:Alpha-glucosidases, family 31 of glycosyl hydrolases
MRVSVEEGEPGFRLLINNPRPIVTFNYRPSRAVGVFEGPSYEGEFLGHRLRVEESNGRLTIVKDLDLKEHVLGLGEKAYELDRRRVRVRMWNLDASAPAPYGWYSDHSTPQYHS